MRPLFLLRFYPVVAVRPIFGVVGSSRDRMVSATLQNDNKIKSNNGFVDDRRLPMNSKKNEKRKKVIVCEGKKVGR